MISSLGPLVACVAFPPKTREKSGPRARPSWLRATGVFVFVYLFLFLHCCRIHPDPSLSLSLHRLLPLESDPDREGRTKEERQPAVKTSTRSNQTPCFKERRSKLRIIIVDEAICDKRELCFLLAPPSVLPTENTLPCLFVIQSVSLSLSRSWPCSKFLPGALPGPPPSFLLSLSDTGGAAFP